MNVLFAIDVYIDDLSLVFVRIITMFLVSLSHLLNRLMTSNIFVKPVTQKIKKNKIPCHA